MSEYGYIKISRKAYDTDPFWNEKRQYSKWEAWEWLIQAATWEDSMRVAGMTTIPLKRGEIVASVRHLCLVWGWKRSRVHDFLGLLFRLERITGQRETPLGTVYLLVNYDFYQSESGRTRTPERTPERTRSGQVADKVKAVKAGESAKASSLARAGASKRCPADFEPDETHPPIAEERAVSLSFELAKFKDFEFDKPKSDWPATFRNWLRRAVPALNGHHKPPNVKPPPEQQEYVTEPYGGLKT